MQLRAVLDFAMCVYVCAHAYLPEALHAGRPGGYWFVFDLREPAVWPQQGTNQLSIELLHREPALLTDVSARVCALMPSCAPPLPRDT